MKDRRGQEESGELSLENVISYDVIIFEEYVPNFGDYKWSGNKDDLEFLKGRIEEIKPTGETKITFDESIIVP